MKQFKLDTFRIPGTTDSHDSRGNQRQQFFVERDPSDHCSTGHKCGNQRMQQGVQAALALDSTPGNGIALMADDLIEKGEFVA
ncbi:hypothetical protein PPTG_16196 [Phytophthora nicotianae INRA-310]|uniref:Uncharacterized protein n=1 Tax=Phytophthora nicotianae (strain INRA-310) TaxID=761204 RepID=W2PNY0_PHYN3|nr:hypothetical protein PPTG_16196 [Phytophthora nicotianae INRA-310]ETN02582.1 hypothetical protein PPTG_16196 [Phytophthora nicotianae INRA-310]